ncbi:MAG: hypothetical protein U9Q05_10270, partial [Thermodesulfobacteriota bacterium]|nr:hypothetical protein [Thermodesulfobacteriota bacterium]
FINMNHIEDNEYRAILPAPWVNSEFIEYLFVTKNNNKQITRTQMFRIEEAETKEAAQWQEAGEVKEVRVDKAQEVVEEYEQMRKEIRQKYRKKRPKYQIESQDVMTVLTEVDESLVSLNGFYDGITVSQVPPTARYGLMTEGLYTAEQISGAGGTLAVSSNTGAASAGTIEASTGMSTAAIVGIGVGAAVVIGGGVAAGIALADKDDDEDDGDTGSDLPGGTGEVKVTLQWSDCNDLDLHVTDPCGNTINYTRRSASCSNRTGRLDIDANAGSCSPNPAENIFWSTAPAGNYTVRVNYFSGSGTSSFVVTTIVDGNRNTFNGSIGSGTQTITSFSR